MPQASDFEFIKDYKVVEGQNEWLFLGHDSNDVLGQHAGTLRFSDQDLERWRDVLDARVEFLSDLGIPYFFLVAPNTHAVYPEHLPADFEPAPDRPIHQLMRHLAEHDSPVRLIYPLEEMIAAKPNRLVSCPVDAHWTDYGAFVVYEHLMDEIAQLVEVRRVEESQITFVDSTTAGDLGFKLDRVGPTVVARLTPAARLVSDNLVHNVGAHIVTECPAAPPNTCVIFGDSYAKPVLRFLCDSFRRTVFAQLPRLDRELVEQEHPAVVISLLAERFLIRAPENDLFPSLAAEAAHKLEAGTIRAQMVFWDTPPWAAP